MAYEFRIELKVVYSIFLHIPSNLCYATAQGKCQKWSLKKGLGVWVMLWKTKNFQVLRRLICLAAFVEISLFIFNDLTIQKNKSGTPALIEDPQNWYFLSILLSHHFIVPFSIYKASRHSSGRWMKGNLVLGIRFHGRWLCQASDYWIKAKLQGIALGGFETVVHGKWSFKRSGRWGKYDCILKLTPYTQLFSL